MVNQELIEHLGLELKENAIVGEKEGYYFSLIKLPMGYITLTGLAFVFDNPVPNKIRLAIQKRLKTTCAAQRFKKGGDVLFVGLPLKGVKQVEKHLENCTTLLNNTLNVFKEMGLAQDGHCFICGSDDETDMSKKVVKGYYVKVHNHCAEMTFQQMVEKARSYKTGNLPLSVILTVVGAFVGTIPTLFTILFMETIYALLFALIPLCAFWGYKLGHAPRKNYMVYIVIIISALMVGGLELLMYTIIAVASGFSSLSQCLSEAGNMSIFLKDVALAYLFLAIGIWISWAYISRTTDKELNNAQGLNQ